MARRRRLGNAVARALLSGLGTGLLTYGELAMKDVYAKKQREDEARIARENRALDEGYDIAKEGRTEKRTIEAEGRAQTRAVENENVRFSHDQSTARLADTLATSRERALLDERLKKETEAKGQEIDLYTSRGLSVPGSKSKAEQEADLAVSRGNANQSNAAAESSRAYARAIDAGKIGGGAGSTTPFQFMQGTDAEGNPYALRGNRASGGLENVTPQSFTPGGGGTPGTPGQPYNMSALPPNLDDAVTFVAAQPKYKGMPPDQIRSGLIQSFPDDYGEQAQQQWRTPPAQAPAPRGRAAPNRPAMPAGFQP